MTIYEHLDELRYRIIVSLVALMVGSAIAYALYGHILRLLTMPLDASNHISGVFVDGLHISGIATAFLIRVKVSIYAGVLIALPVLLFQLWRFITPGLNPKEKRYAIPFVVGSLALFAMGAVFAYIVLRPALGFLLGFAKGLKPTIFIDEYLKFVIFMILAFGITFELPMVLIFLAGVGMVSSAWLRRYRRHAIVACFVIGAVATPSQDPYSMTLMAVPLYVLYELAVLIIRRVMKK